MADRSSTIPSFGRARDLLSDRLREPAPGRIQLLTGPRQVGKTTLLLELEGELGGVYAACDSPEASQPGFWERLWTRVVEAAERQRAIVYLDEVLHLGDWAERLKGEWDRARRRELPIHVVATGSSAVGVGEGALRTLTGRFERLELTHWSAASLSEAFALEPDDAAHEVVLRGSYPGAFEFRADERRWSAYVRDAIVEPAIGRDVLALSSVRKPGLLRQVFGVCLGLPAQIVSLQKLRGELRDRGALETIAHYLDLLEDAYLVAPLQKFSTRPHRRRAAPPKIVVLSNALLAATHPDGPPDADVDPERFGVWLENACIAHAWNAGQDVTYWREEPLEVDAILHGDWGRWAIEIKSGTFGPRDLRGLLEFTARYPDHRPLVICEQTGAESAARAGVASLDWRTYLNEGPTG